MIIINGKPLDIKHYVIREIRGIQKVETLIRNPEMVDEIYDMMVNRAINNKEDIVIELIDYDLGIKIKTYDSSTDNR